MSQGNLIFTCSGNHNITETGTPVCESGAQWSAQTAASVNAPPSPETALQYLGAGFTTISVPLATIVAFSMLLRAAKATANP